MSIVLYALTALLYGCLALHAWLSGFEASVVQPAVGSGDAATRGSPSGALAARLFLLIALLCHGALLHETVFLDGQTVFGFAQALSVMVWLGICLYWIESQFVALDGLRLMVLPMATFAVPLPLLFPGSAVLANPASPLFKIHFLIANAAYGLLALAAFHAVLMLIIEQRLHRLLPRAETGLAAIWLRWLDAMPPLMTLERLLFRLIAIGFALLTLTIASGVLFSEQLFGRALRFDHKTVFAILSWLMFGTLLLGRCWRGWRGRIALRWVLVSFATLLLAYVGSRFVIEVLLQRVT